MGPLGERGVMSDDNNSTRKLRVYLIPKADGRRWVGCEFLKWGTPGNHPQWIPAFHDMHRILRAMAECEDESYPPAKGFAGRRRLGDFLKDVVYEPDFNTLAVRYQIPERDRDQVVRTNGARAREWQEAAWQLKLFR